MSECVLFDFDETLTRRDTTRLLVAMFWRMYPWRVIAAGPHILCMRRAKGRPDELQAAKFRMFGTLLRGMTKADLSPLIEAYKVAARQIIRQSVWEKLDRHLACGTTVLIVTASPRIAVEAVFEGSPVAVIGTEFQMTGGRYTGKLDQAGCYGAEKVPAINAWIATQPRPLRIIEAWSDNWSDAPMMRMAERRHWICPPGDPDQISRDDPAGDIFHDAATVKDGTGR